MIFFLNIPYNWSILFLKLQIMFHKPLIKITYSIVQLMLQMQELFKSCVYPPSVSKINAGLTRVNHSIIFKTSKPELIPKRNTEQFYYFSVSFYITCLWLLCMILMLSNRKRKTTLNDSWTSLNMCQNS